MEPFVSDNVFEDILRGHTGKDYNFVDCVDNMILENGVYLNVVETFNPDSNQKFVIEVKIREVI